MIIDKVLACAASAWIAGCGAGGGVPLPNESTEPLPAGDYQLVARLAHICDTQIVDEESPARLPFAVDFIPAAWRPQESSSTQLLDGIVRAINRQHANRGRIDFVACTGDATDNAQWNELTWFLDVLDGKRIEPTSGPDDRPADKRPEPLLDPHASFMAQGLYRSGVHGPLPSIPWYNVVGNHDRFALGVFPIVQNLFHESLAPLPLPGRIGLVLPEFLYPLSAMSYALITPAHPGPPIPTLPRRIRPNEARRFYTTPEFVHAHFDTLTGPRGHGLAADRPLDTWYSASPVPGLRLVALDSCKPGVPVPAGFYSEGAIGGEQITFLRRELRGACEAGELVLVLTHHPSTSLHPLYGSAITADAFRATLNDYPCVVALLTGHTHAHHVEGFGRFVEISTASTLDYPQEGRFIEVWRSANDVQLRYWVFSHLDEEGATLDPDGDPLFRLREAAFEMARRDARVGND